MMAKQTIYVSLKVILVLALAMIFSATSPGVQAGFTLYASQSNGTVEQISSLGAKSTFVSGLSSPTGIAISPLTGHIFVATPNAIQQYTPGGASVGVFATANLSNPQTMAFDSTGDLYVANQINNGSTNKYSSTGTLLYALGTGDPSGVVVDTSGNVFICNINSSTIFEFSSTGTFKGTLTSANLTNPTQMVLDGLGNLYVDNLSGVVEKFSTSTGADEGKFATQSGPSYGLAYDPSSGNFFQSNASGSIVELSATGQYVETFASGLTGPTYLALAPVPEPSSLVLCTISGLTWLVCTRTRRKRKAA